MCQELPSEENKAVLLKVSFNTSVAEKRVSRALECRSETVLKGSSWGLPMIVIKWALACRP